MDLGTLPQNPWVWIAIVVGLAVVLVYALSRRKGRFEIKVGAVSANVDKNAPGQDRVVTVAKDLSIDGTAGDITGVRGDASVAANRPVDVASGATVRGKVGDITGVDASGNRRS